MKDTFLADPLVDRVDDVEVRAWGAFIATARVLAGES
jgi:hypothetical protein